MIVPSMTLQEIRKELFKEVPILRRKITYVADDLRKNLPRQTLLCGYEKFYDYTSKYKNQWMYQIRFTKMKYISSMILLYHNGKGHTGIIVTPEMNIVYHTVHFWQRFNERCKLGFTDYKDIIRAYMHENNFIKFTNLEETERGVFKIFSYVNSGIVLGTFNDDLHLVKAHTFVPNDMLSKNQSIMHEEAKNALEKYKGDSKLLN